MSRYSSNDVANSLD